MDEYEKLDLLLAYYRAMLTDHDDKNNSRLDIVCHKIIGAGSNHSAFRRYRQRLIADGMIERDSQTDGGDGRFMVSHKGLTYSYVDAREAELSYKLAEISRKARMEQMASRTDTNTHRLADWTTNLARYTKWLAVATALLVLVELAKGLMEYFCHRP